MEPGEPRPAEEQEDEEFRSSVFQVVGGTPEEQDMVLGNQVFEMLSDTDKDFEYKGKTYKVEDFEREKTPEEAANTEAVLQKLEDFLRRTGDDNPIKIRPEQVHILDRDKAKAANLPLINFFNAEHEFIGIYDVGNALANMQGVAHEAIHLHSFKSLDIEKDKSISTRRFGISTRIRGGQTVYFEQINEAVTQKLVQILDREYFASIPGLQAELAKRQDHIDKCFKGHPDEQRLSEELAYVNINYDLMREEGVSYSYPKERLELDALIKDIFEKNKKENGGMFENEDEVFSLFGQAVMGGRMLDLARVVESTYGKGSFRKLGEATKSSEKK